MADLVRQLPAQLGWAVPVPAGGWPRRLSGEPVAVLTTGGGGAAAGYLVGSLLQPRAAAPFVVSQGYEPPGWVGHNTPVLAVSYSGETEETVAATRLAHSRGARVVAVTTGGSLAAWAGEVGVPVVALPTGWPPRAALGYFWAVLLEAARALGLSDVSAVERAEAAAQAGAAAAAWLPEAPVAENDARRIAGALAGRIPVVYGAAPVTEAVAGRWKRQFGENSKLLAFTNVVPHLHHDEVVGFSAPADLLDRVGLVLIRDGDEPNWARRRLDATRDLARGRLGAVVETPAPSGPVLARQLTLVALGDWVSVYLAAAAGVDPVPVEVIDRLKARMAEGV